MESICKDQARTPPVGSAAYYYGLYVFPVLFFIGVGGNILNLAVFNSRGMRTKANCFLSSMAVADIGFFLAMFMMYTSLYDYFWYSKYFIAVYYYSKSSVMFFSNSFSATSIWFAVMVTVERMIAVRFPLKVRLLLTRRRIALVIAFIVFSSFVLQLYQFFFWKVGTRPGCTNPNETVYVLLAYRENTSYHAYMYKKVSNYISVIVVVLVPLLIMAVLNGIIVQILWENRVMIARLANATERSQNSVKERKVTVMVLIIVTAFLACNLPSAVCNILDLFQKALVCTTWANYLVCVNKALNFLLYCCASRGFRKKCKMLFARMFYERLCRADRPVEERDEENGLLTTMTQTVGVGQGATTNNGNSDRHQHHHHQQTSRMLSNRKSLGKQ